MLQAASSGFSGSSGRPTRSREPIRKPAATVVAPVAEVAVTAISGGPSAYRIRHGTSDEQVIAEVRDYAEAHQWQMDLTNQQILDAIGWAHLPGSAVRRIQSLVAEAAAADGQGIAPSLDQLTGYSS